MPKKEVDRREEILSSKGSYDLSGVLYQKEHAIDAMDDYMKEQCLLLLEYMAEKDVKCTWYNHEVLGKQYVFKYRGQELSKEQLFENFL